MLRITTFRKAKKITAKQLAEHVNVAESTMCLYENGKRTPDYKTLFAISEFLGLPISYLFGEQVPAVVNRIRCIRSYHSKTKAEFAKLLNVSEETVAKWEEGAIPISENHLSTISKNFKLPIEFIAGYSFYLKRPTNTWASDEEDDYKIAEKSKCEDIILFKFGQGYFKDSEDEKEKPALKGEPSPNRQKLIDFAWSVPEDKIEHLLQVMQLILEAPQ